MTRIEITQELQAVTTPAFGEDLEQAWKIEDIRSFEQSARRLETVLIMARELFKQDLYNEALEGRVKP